MDTLFYRLDENGNAIILDVDGCACERIPEATTIYPIGADLSCAYQHIDGIVLTVEDADKLGIRKEN